ncbi:MAG: spondin domain-containing protein [Gammaproteobacteria bacterium]|nr:spondin domain-containing protein [Gammaproteobacteria bacterium]
MKKSLLALALAMGVGSAANAATWDVKITNLTNGNHFTPLLVTAHASTAHLYTPGIAASAALQGMAECGDLSGLLALTEVGAADADTIVNPVGTGDLLAPGASTTAMITTSATHLSIVAMILPTNDGFVGLDAMQIPTAAGTYTYFINGYDAGTEANTELKDVASSCAINQEGYPGAPSGHEGTGGSGMVGADSNTMVHVHRGVLGDSDSTGGLSDLDSTVHRWQNPIAKVTVTVN